MSDDTFLPSILSPAHTCPDCSVSCRAAIVYDPEMRERADGWVCPECDARYYRTDDAAAEWGFLHGVARRLSRR